MTDMHAADLAFMERVKNATVAELEKMLVWACDVWKYIAVERELRRRSKGR